MQDRRHTRQFRLFGERRSEEWRQTLQLVAVIAPFAILSVLAVTTLMFSLTKPLRLAPPFSYDAPTFVASPLAVCPGDPLTYTIALHVNRAPTRIIISRHWINVATHQSAAATHIADEQVVAFPKGDVGPRGGVRHVPVPAGLSPGRYEMREAAGEYGSGVDVMSVPFEVKVGCK